MEDGAILGREDTVGSEDTLEGLYARPFSLARPMRQTVPFVFALPHSGRCYPPEFVRASRLTPLTLRRSEEQRLRGKKWGLGHPDFVEQVGVTIQ